MRSERDRSIARAIARAAAAQALMAPIARRSNPAPVEAAPETPTASSVGAGDDLANTAPRSQPVTTPAVTPPPAKPTPPPTPPKNTAALPNGGPQKPPQNITSDEAAPAAASTKQNRPGIFALVLTGMFLLPSAGVALLLVGAAHLRGHSFLSGSMILAVGCFLLWGAWSLAHLIDPAALTRSEPAAPRSTTDNEPLRPMRALQPGLLWNNES